MNCPHCGKPANIKTELACGDIWKHSHGGCTFYTLTRDGSGPRWHTLETAWMAHRHQYDAEDKWAQGWDAHFAGKYGKARRLWNSWQNQQGARHAEAAA